MYKKYISKIEIKYLKKNEMESHRLRAIYKKLFNIDVGMYSYGCFDENRIPAGTKIGRYCSFANTCQFFSRNHGIDFISLHPYLYNAKLGVIDSDTIPFSTCIIEDDVWIGHNAIILPNVRNIGRGSIIAAGAVVSKDVPPYAIVAGNPAIIKRYRFNYNTIHEIENSKWWLISKELLKKEITTNPQFIYKPEI